MLKFMPAAIGILTLGFAASASAIPVTFDLASSSAVSIDSFDGGLLCDLTGCGASVELNPALGLLSNTLSAGEQWNFDFFSINFHGLGSGSGTLSAALSFDAPTGAPDASGNGVGDFFTAWIFTAGSLFWTTQPGEFLLADGTSYSVFFENLFGVTIGNDVNVRARLTLNKEPVIGVPEPGTLGLFGLGLLGIGFASRARSRARAD